MSVLGACAKSCTIVAESTIVAEGCSERAVMRLRVLMASGGRGIVMNSASALPAAEVLGARMWWPTVGSETDDAMKREFQVVSLFLVSLISREEEARCSVLAANRL